MICRSKWLTKKRPGGGFYYDYDLFYWLFFIRFICVSVRTFGSQKKFYWKSKYFQYLEKCPWKIIKGHLLYFGTHLLESFDTSFDVSFGLWKMLSF